MIIGPGDGSAVTGPGDVAGTTDKIKMYKVFNRTYALGDKY